MSAHEPLWVHDRYKCKCFNNSQFQVSCSAIDEIIAVGQPVLTPRLPLRAGQAFRIELPLSKILLIKFEIKAHEMSTFSGESNDTRLVSSVREMNGDFEHWLGVEENYYPVVRALIDYYKSKPQYEGLLELFVDTKRRRINCASKNHVPTDESLHLLLARQFGIEAVALALTYTMSNTGKCFSCWDAGRLVSTGALVPIL